MWVLSSKKCMAVNVKGIGVIKGKEGKWDVVGSISGKPEEGLLLVAFKNEKEAEEYYQGFINAIEEGKAVYRGNENECS